MLSPQISHRRGFEEERIRLMPPKFGKLLFHLIPSFSQIQAQSCLTSPRLSSNAIYAPNLKSWFLSCLLEAEFIKSMLSLSSEGLPRIQ